MTKITIAGQVFEAPAPYAEGHTLKANEAGALNQVLAENLRNNFAKKVKDAGEIDEAKLSALQAEFTEYANAYEFGARISGGGGAARMDPVESEARKIARDTISAKIKDSGGKVKDVDKEKLDAAIDALSKREDIVKLAAKRVKERNNVVKSEGGDLLGELGLQAA